MIKLIKVTSHKDEDSTLPSQNVELDVSYNKSNDLSSGEEEEDSDNGKERAPESKETSSRIKKKHPIENIIQDLNA